ncbi:unnamed protein product [Soboliphyme baturini]|uniref:Beta/gamma crystallin 'Greek key' domain-containing protein n=1 Tax=Soboliphyme baturini TaxID=241478 RepID=A0A183IG86_9BILA|nr:unnamed protein product [Soboliphyme baturini]
MDAFFFNGICVRARDVMSRQAEGCRSVSFQRVTRTATTSMLVYKNEFDYSGMSVRNVGGGRHVLHVRWTAVHHVNRSIASDRTGPDQTGTDRTGPVSMSPAGRAGCNG